MPVVDTLAALALELGAMPGRERRAILRALTPDEHDAVEQALAERGDTVARAAIVPSEVFSPTLANCIAAARAGPSGGAATTAAARQALLAAADALDPARAPVAKPGTAPGRSLLDAFGGMLAPRTPRP